ncbi:MAG: glycosyltransferase family 2 protein [Candidatus Sumerlaeia bacterium]
MNPTPTPRIHLIAVLYNHAPWIEVCLEAARVQTLPPWQITVIDNCSSDDGADIVARRFPEVRIIRSPRNLGFSGGCNRGVQAARGADYLVMINPDAILALDALERLHAAFTARSDMGILGCKLLEPDVETIQHVGVRIAGNGFTSNVGQGEIDRGQYKGVREATAVSGAVMAARADVWCELGGFDETFWPAYFEETDLCLRARRAGWGVGVACDAVATHFRASAERWQDRRFLENYFASRGRFLCKHYRGKDWLAKYLPAELRWMCGSGSNGMRAMALRALWQAHKLPAAATR